MVHAHHGVAPHAVFARYTLEALDLLLAFIALPGLTVPTHPVMSCDLLKCGTNMVTSSADHSK